MNVLALVWKAVTVIVVAPMYWVVVSDGLRMTIAPLGHRLYNVPLPGVSGMRNVESLHRLDIAHIFAIILLFAAWYLSVQCLKVLLVAADEMEPGPWNRPAYMAFTTILTLVILMADACLFYRGIAFQMDMMWSESESASAAPALATVAYVGVLLFVSFVTVRLEHRDPE